MEDEHVEGFGGHRHRLESYVNDAQQENCLGSGPGDVREIVVLNRIIRYGRDDDDKPFIEMEADPRHAAIVVATLGLKDGAKVKAVCSPGVKRTAEDIIGASEMRRAVPDFPICLHEDQLPSVGRAGVALQRKGVGETHVKTHISLLGHGEGNWEVPPPMPEDCSTHDHAAEAEGRGGQGRIKPRRLSHDEEVNARTRGVSWQACHHVWSHDTRRCGHILRKVGVLCIAGVWQWPLAWRQWHGVQTDSSAGRGATLRLCAGRLRHIQTQFLWIQQVFVNDRAKVGAQPQRPPMHKPPPSSYEKRAGNTCNWWCRTCLRRRQLSADARRRSKAMPVSSHRSCGN